MEQDKSAIEILKDFALNSGRQIDFSEKQYPRGNGIHPRVFSLTQAIVSDKVNPKIYFVSFSDSKGFGDNAMYSGLFFSIEAPPVFSIKIQKKYLLDKLNPFLKRNRFDSSFYSFNSKVIIEENDLALTGKLFNKRLTQELTLEILNLDGRIRMGVNSIEIDIVPDLKGKSTFGIYITRQWLLDETLLEKLFSLTNRLRNELSHQSKTNE